LRVAVNRIGINSPINAAAIVAMQMPPDDEGSDASEHEVVSSGKKKGSKKRVRTMNIVDADLAGSESDEDDLSYDDNDDDAVEDEDDEDDGDGYDVDVDERKGRKLAGKEGRSAAEEFDFSVLDDDDEIPTGKSKSSKIKDRKGGKGIKGRTTPEGAAPKKLLKKAKTDHSAASTASVKKSKKLKAK
jgi:hypothetical protein